MSWDFSNHQNWTWDEIPLGAMTLESGTSVKNHTGGWRVKRPIWDAEKCINCHQCWIFCPDTSIISTDQTITGIDYDHCKGCGICVQVCPVKCIELVDEKSVVDQTGGEK